MTEHAAWYMGLADSNWKEIDFPGYRRARVSLDPDVCEATPTRVHLKKRAAFPPCVGTADVMATGILLFDAFGRIRHRFVLDPSLRIVNGVTAQVEPSECAITGS